MKTILSLFRIAGLAFPLAACTSSAMIPTSFDAALRNPQGQHLLYLQQDELVNIQGQVLARFEGDTLYNLHGQALGVVAGANLRNLQGQTLGTVSGTDLLNAQGQPIMSVEGNLLPDRARVGLGFFFFW